MTATLLCCRALLGLGRPEDAEKVLVSRLPCFFSGTCPLRAAPPRALPEALLAAARLRGEALWRTGDAKAAIERLREVARIDAPHSDARSAAERLCVLLSSIDTKCSRGNELYRTGAYAAAASEYRAILEDVLKCDAPSPRFCANVASNHAAALMGLRDFAAAVAECTRALGWHPQHVKVRLRRARAHVALADLPAATADFEAVMAALSQGQKGAGAGGRTDATSSEVAAELLAATRADEARRLAEKERVAKERAQRERAERERAAAKERADRERAARGDDDFYDDFSARFGGASWFGDGKRGTGASGGRSGRARPAAPPPPPPQPTDHWGVLGLTPAATTAEIRKAYRSLSLRVHPDKHGGCTVAAEHFKAVAAAHEVLTDPVTRRAHDEEVRSFKSRWPGAWAAAREGEAPAMAARKK